MVNHRFERLMVTAALVILGASSGHAQDAAGMRIFSTGRQRESLISRAAPAVSVATSAPCFGLSDMFYTIRDALKLAIPDRADAAAPAQLR